MKINAVFEPQKEGGYTAYIPALPGDDHPARNGPFLVIYQVRKPQHFSDKFAAFTLVSLDIFGSYRFVFGHV